jgi:hypothetical protein
MLKATFDQAGVDIKEALNALIAELETSTSASNIGANVSSVTTKTVQAILTNFEGAIANRYTKAEAETLLTTGTNDLVADIDVNLTTGVITVTKKDGTVETFDTALEKVPARFEIVESNGTYALKITNVDGTSTQTDITHLMNIYTFENNDYITFEVTGEGNEKTVTANIKDNSIGLDKLSLSVVSTLEGYMASARDSANAAKTSETNARNSEINALEAESTAVTKAQEASDSATNAKTSEEKAEYWAKQTQGNAQGGDMTKAIYDTDGDGVVDDAEKLGGQLPSYYAKATDLGNKTDKTYVDGQISTVNTLIAAKADTTYVNTELGKKATSKNFTATIPTTGWSSSAPYTNTITVSGMLASDSNFPVSPVYSTDKATRTAQAEAWGKVSMIAAGANLITVTCDEEIPATAIPIQITVVR